MEKITIFGKSGHTISKLHLFDGVTASFGIATLDPHHGAEDLITRADAALYRAKEAGRNQISF